MTEHIGGWVLEPLFGSILAQGPIQVPPPLCFAHPTHPWFVAEDGYPHMVTTGLVDLSWLCVAGVAFCMWVCFLHFQVFQTLQLCHHSIGKAFCSSGLVGRGSLCAVGFLFSNLIVALEGLRTGEVTKVVDLEPMRVDRYQLARFYAVCGMHFHACSITLVKRFTLGQKMRFANFALLPTWSGSSLQFSPPPLATQAFVSQAAPRQNQASPALVLLKSPELLDLPLDVPPRRDEGTLRPACVWPACDVSHAAPSFSPWDIYLLVSTC